jgi:hypothetical protein
MKYGDPITYHSKDMANVNVFADIQIDRQINRRTDKQTDRPKTICPRYFDTGA